jgi:uncharacterized damage-inducible protein DinB
MADKETLHRYLRQHRAALLWKLDGLPERQLRMPLTPTGTNLLGLLKHVASVDVGYFGDVFDRPFPVPWDALLDEDPTADLWATAEESAESIKDFAQRAWAHSDRTIDELALDARGSVSWWEPDRREVTLGQIMVHVIAETARHAGHADILRELTDGSAGLRSDDSNLAELDAEQWRAQVDRLRSIAESFPDT